MVIDTDHLVNQIHAQVEGVAETGFPMDVFPERIQKIIYDLVTYENYNMEYTASIILSAFHHSLCLCHSHWQHISCKDQRQLD